jgi:hypothetical protein
LCWIEQNSLVHSIYHLPGISVTLALGHFLNPLSGNGGFSLASYLYYTKKSSLHLGASR